MCNVLTGYQTFGNLAAATTYELDVALPYMVLEEECLTQLEISIKEPLTTTTTMTFFYAEAYLIRAANLERILIDRGVVVGGFGQRNFVGFVGRIGYSDGDFLHIVMKNTSGQSVTWNVEAAYEKWSSGPDAYKGNCQGISRLAKNVRVFQTAHRVATQGNGAGGAVVIDLSFASASRLVMLSVLNSGTNTLGITANDEDFARLAKLGYAGSALANAYSLPSIGANASTSDNNASCVGLLFPAGSVLTLEQAGAGAQNDTMTVAFVFEVLGIPEPVVWSKARSTNQADVALAASTITEANTWCCTVSP